MEWIVDGMNLIGSRPDGWWRDRAGARRRLVGELHEFVEARAERATVVFDGRPSGAERAADPTPRLAVEFAPGGPNAADRRIAALVEAHDHPAALTVVTSDGALADQVRGSGAAVMGVGAFRRLFGVRSPPAVDPALRLGLELAPPASGGDEVLAWRRAVRAAEEAGFGCVWQSGGAHQGPPTADALALAGAVAASTSAVAVGAVAALSSTARHPSVLARGLTALDLVSGGRAAALLEPGPELAASPVVWEHLVEAVAVCHTLFSQEVSTYPGRHYAVLEAANRPLPRRSGGPLLVVRLPSSADGAGSGLAGLVESGALAGLLVEGGVDEVERARGRLVEAGVRSAADGPALLWRGGSGGPEGADLRRAGAEGLIVRPGGQDQPSPEAVFAVADHFGSGPRRERPLPA